jgi:DNA polymerase-3 subunit epsilon
LRQRGFVAIDLETTGLDSRRDRIVSLAALSFVESEVVPALVSLVNPGGPIPASATKIHGIDDAAVAESPDEPSVVARLDALCAGQVIVGHGVAFDVAVLARARGHTAATSPPLATLCTQRLAASLHPTWSDLSLEAVCGALGVPITGRHTAAGDALTAGHLFLALIPRLQTRGIRTLAESLWLQERAAIRG